MTTSTKSPTDTALDGLILALEAAEDAIKLLRKHSDRLCSTADTDGDVQPDDLMNAYVSSLDLSEASHMTGRHLRTLEQLAGGEPCS